MRKQKLERAVVLSLMLAALQQNSVLAGDAISKEEYTGDKDKYYSYQDAVSIDKFVENKFSYKAASAVFAGSSGGNCPLIKILLLTLTIRQQQQISMFMPFVPVIMPP